MSYHSNVFNPNGSIELTDKVVVEQPIENFGKFLQCQFSMDLFEILAQGVDMFSK